MKVPKPKEIENLLRGSKYRAMRSKEISKRLGMPVEARPALKKVLGKMVSEGKLSRIDGGKYAVTAQLNKANNKKASAQPKPNSSKDKKTTDKKTTDKKTTTQPISSINELLKAGKVLGKYVKTGKTGKVIPKDDKIPHVTLQGGDTRTLKNNSLVVVKLKNKLSRDGTLQGHILEVLGKAGDLEVERKGILIEYDMPLSFPGNCLRELDNIPDAIAESEIKNRTDLRKETIFTIDGETAKDFDDAVGIYKIAKGYRLLVSIADVSYYVKLGSDIDNEALNRATSVYMPDKVIPMLPHRLSDDLCSLVAHKDRLTKTVEMDFNSRGEVVDSRIYNSVIRSSARLTYTGVTERLLKKGRVPKSEMKVLNKLRLMMELYELIRARRSEKGELSFELPEPDIIKDELGRTVDIVRTERNEAHGLIEEFMVAANEAVANFIYRARVPSMYRIHDVPDKESLNELSDGLKKLGYLLVVNDKMRTLDLQRIINKSRNKSNQLAVIMLILRSLKRAVYSTLREGHFGLALDHYTHFTSPIRRYPDLIVHRIVNALINNQSHPYTEDTLEWVADKASKKERTADLIERESINLERAHFMKSYIEEDFDGIVLSVLPFGMFVEVEKLFVEGLVPKDSVKNWRKRWFDIGQKVSVKVVEADVEKRRITLNLTS
jgi:ribonuclease R